MQTKVWVVFQRDEAGIDHPVGARLTLEATVGLAKQAPNRGWHKLIATKDAGPSKFDIQPPSRSTKGAANGHSRSEPDEDV